MENYKAQYYEDALQHYGIKGMRWGVRRYQDKGGSLNSAGKERYKAKGSDSKVTKRVKKDLAEMSPKEFKQKYQVSNARYMKRVDKYGDPYMNSPLAKFGKKIEGSTASKMGKKNIENFQKLKLKANAKKLEKIDNRLSKKDAKKAGDNTKTRKLKLKKEALIQRINKVNQRSARTGMISSDTYSQYQKDLAALIKVERKLSQKKKKK